MRRAGTPVLVPAALGAAPKHDNTHTSVHGPTVHAGLVRDALRTRHLVPQGTVRTERTLGAPRPEPGRPARNRGAPGPRQEGQSPP